MMTNTSLIQSDTATAEATAAAAVAGHNANPTAHNWRSHTVAELYAYTDLNRPPIPLPCSDCLTTRGVGANCCWDVGSQVWRTTEGTVATTDLWVFYRSLALDRPMGNGRTRKMAFSADPSPLVGQNSGSNTKLPVAYGAGPTDSLVLTTSTSANAGVRTGGTATEVISTGATESYYARSVFGVSAASSAVEEFNFRIGAESASFTLSANAFGFAYDRGNQLGALNPTNTQTLIFFARKSPGVNVLRDTGVAITASKPDEHVLELLFDGTNLRYAVNGTEGTPIAAADVPANQLLGFMCLNKSAGTTSRSVYVGSPFCAARYTTPVA